VLEPPPEMFETLRRWGVHTFGALGALPAAQLSERLGQEGVRLQALACGRTSRPLVPVEPALEFEEVMELEYSVTLLDPLAFILGRMLDQLCRRLEARSLATNELRLRLELENTAPDIETGRANWKNHESGIGSRGRDSRNLRLPVPTRNPKLLLKLCLLHLKADPPQAPILKVMLTAQPAKPRVAQGGLFLPLSPHPEKLELTLARIAGVVGKERAGSPELEDSHQPDAFRMNRFHPGELRVAVPAPPSSPNRKPGVTSRGTPNSRFPTSDSRHLMTLRFFRPPQPATVELVAGRPVRVFALGVHGDVIAASGPWRNSGSWWRDDAWEEDEWDIEVRSVVPGPWSVAGELSRAGLVKPRTTDNGLKKGLYRIYRESPTGSWFIRGIYD